LVFVPWLCFFHPPAPRPGADPPPLTFGVAYRSSGPSVRPDRLPGPPASAFFSFPVLPACPCAGPASASTSCPALPSPVHPPAPHPDPSPLTPSPRPLSGALPLSRCAFCLHLAPPPPSPARPRRWPILPPRACLPPLFRSLPWRLPRLFATGGLCTVRPLSAVAPLRCSLARPSRLPRLPTPTGFPRPLPLPCPRPSSAFFARFSPPPAPPAARHTALLIFSSRLRSVVAPPHLGPSLHRPLPARGRPCVPTARFLRRHAPTPPHAAPPQPRRSESFPYLSAR